MERFNMYLSTKQIKSLKNLSKKDLSVSEHIRIAIDKYLESKKVVLITKSPSGKIL